MDSFSRAHFDLTPFLILNPPFIHPSSLPSTHHVHPLKSHRAYAFIPGLPFSSFPLRLTPFIDMPLSFDQESLEILRYRLYEEGNYHGQQFTDQAASSLFQALYRCLMGPDSELFLQNTNAKPSVFEHKGSFSFLHGNRPWSLAETQQKERQAGILLGAHQNGHVGRKGKICGNYLARGDRCFNCKWVSH